MPTSRPMPSIGARCHELRVDDVEGSRTWRVVYRIDPDAIVIADWFFKKTEQTASSRIERCRQRLRQYDRMGG